MAALNTVKARCAKFEVFRYVWVLKRSFTTSPRTEPCSRGWTLGRTLSSISRRTYRRSFPSSTKSHHPAGGSSPFTRVAHSQTTTWTTPQCRAHSIMDVLSVLTVAPALRVLTALVSPFLANISISWSAFANRINANQIISWSTVTKAASSTSQLVRARVSGKSLVFTGPR